MNDRLEFWRNSPNWPHDSVEFVFLGRAVNSIGEALFCNDWTGEEPIIDLLPRRSGYYQHFLGSEEGGKSCKFTPSEPSTFRLLRTKIPTKRSLIAELNADSMNGGSAVTPALMRYSAVQSKIAAWSRAGELETAWRAKAGGQEIIIPKEWWNIDVLSPRFDFCQVNPNAPFGEGNTGEDFGWIFATRESLLKAVAGLFKWQDAITNRNRKKAAEGAKPTELWKREIEEKYRDRIKLFEGRTPPTRVADEAYLKETFGLNRHRARDLRRRLAPAHWKTAGTRKRKAP